MISPIGRLIAAGLMLLLAFGVIPVAADLMHCHTYAAVSMSLVRMGGPTDDYTCSDNAPLIPNPESKPYHCVPAGGWLDCNGYVEKVVSESSCTGSELEIQCYNDNPRPITTSCRAIAKNGQGKYVCLAHEIISGINYGNRKVKCCGLKGVTPEPTPAPPTPPPVQISDSEIKCDGSSSGALSLNLEQFGAPSMLGTCNTQSKMDDVDQKQRQCVPSTGYFCNGFIAHFKNLGSCATKLEVECWVSKTSSANKKGHSIQTPCRTVSPTTASRQLKCNTDEVISGLDMTAQTAQCCRLVGFGVAPTPAPPTPQPPTPQPPTPKPPTQPQPTPVPATPLPPTAPPRPPTQSISPTMSSSSTHGKTASASNTTFPDLLDQPVSVALKMPTRLSEDSALALAMTALLSINGSVVEAANGQEGSLPMPPEVTDGGSRNTSSGSLGTNFSSLLEQRNASSADEKVFRAAFELSQTEATASQLCVRIVPTSGHRFTPSAELAVAADRAPSILADPDALSTAQQRSPQSMEICLGPLPKPLTRADEEVITLQLRNDDGRSSPVMPSVSPRLLEEHGGVVAFIDLRIKVERDDFVSMMGTVSSGAGLAAGAAAMMGGGPGAAAAAQRQELLGKAVWCPQPLSQDPPAIEESPTQLSYGDGEFAPFVGAAYSNVAICLAFVAFVTAITAICALCMTDLVESEEQASRPGAALRQASKWVVACSQTGFPGKLGPLLMFLYQPTLSAAMAVVLYDNSENQTHRYVCGALAAVLVLMFVGIPMACARALLRESQLGTAPPIGYLPRPRSQVTGSCSAWLLAQTGRWESRFEAPPDATDPQANGFPNWAPHVTDRFDSVVGDYRPGTHLTVVFDTLLGTAASLVLAYNPKTTGECIAVHGGTLLVFTLGLVMAAVRPFQRGCHNAFYAVIALLQWLMSVASIVLVNTSEAAAMSEWEAWFLLADATVRVVVLVWTAAQVAEGVYEMLLPDEISRFDRQRLQCWRSATHANYSLFLHGELEEMAIPARDTWSSYYDGETYGGEDDGGEYEYLSAEETAE